MAELSKEQCEKLKEWGMGQTHLDVVHYYDVNLDGPRWAIHTNGGKLDEWEIKIPTITELKEFAWEMAQEFSSHWEWKYRPVGISTRWYALRKQHTAIDFKRGGHR